MKKKKQGSKNIKINQIKLIMIFNKNLFLSSTFGDAQYFTWEKKPIANNIIVKQKKIKFQKVLILY